MFLKNFSLPLREQGISSSSIGRFWELDLRLSHFTWLDAPAHIGNSPRAPDFLSVSLGCNLPHGYIKQCYNGIHSNKAPTSLRLKN